MCVCGGVFATHQGFRGVRLEGGDRQGEKERKEVKERERKGKRRAVRREDINRERYKEGKKIKINRR